MSYSIWLYKLHNWCLKRNCVLAVFWKSVWKAGSANRKLWSERSAPPPHPLYFSISLITAVFVRIRENEELRQSRPVAFSAVDVESHAGWEDSSFRGIWSGTTEGHALWTGFCSSGKKQGIWDTGPQNRHPSRIFSSFSLCPHAHLKRAMFFHLHH